MAKCILDYFPGMDTYNTYIEPFGGSFGVALHNTDIPQIEIYNDLDHNVYALFKVLVDPNLFEEFRKSCDLFIYSEEVRSKWKEELRNMPFEGNDDSLLKRALMFFYVNRTSVNGVGGFSINLCVRRGMSKSCSDMLSTIEGLPQLHDRLSRVIVTCKDGIKLINRYANNEDVFIYADPPYHQSTRTSARYAVDMNNDDQERFIDECINAKCKLLISGYDCEPYRRLEENGFKRVEFVVHTTGGDRKKKDKTECLWMNYDVIVKDNDLQ